MCPASGVEAQPGPAKATIAARPATKIMQGDWVWENAGTDAAPEPPWHSYKGQRRFVMLMGDNHVELFSVFVLKITVDAP